MWTYMAKVIGTFREYANTTCKSFARIVCLCVMYDSHSKQHLFPYAPLPIGRCNRNTLFSARYEMYLY